MRTCSRDAANASFEEPDFPLLPVSKGFCISLSKALNQFRDALRAAEICGIDDIAAQKEDEEGKEKEEAQK